LAGVLAALYVYVAGCDGDGWMDGWTVMVMVMVVGV